MKKSYHVITDIALNPLPSDRAKDKNKSKDKDNKNDGNQDAQSNDRDKSADKQKTKGKDASKKLSAADLKKLRNGQSLDSKDTPKAAEKMRAPQQNINMGMMLRQQGGSSLI